MNSFFDCLERLPPLSLSRNDPCLCGNGLKYKKCCLAKNRSFVPSAVRLESFEIKADALTPEESKNNFSAVSPKDEELIAALNHNLLEHRNDSYSRETFFEKRFEDGMKFWREYNSPPPLRYRPGFDRSKIGQYSKTSF